MYGKSFRPELARLHKDRVRYPFRLVRTSSKFPKPESINPIEFGEFCRYPMKGGDEWLFKYKEGRDKFINRFGGTILGDQ